MPKKDQPNYTELTHQVVRDSPEPLSFADIVRRVQAIAPIKTANPKNTLRGAISQSRLIAATGDGRYGWMPRLMNGSALRLTLSKPDLERAAIEFGDELREALWPTFFEIQKREDRSPVHVRLPDRTVTDIPLTFLGESQWGTTGSPEFWKWFKQLKAKPGDHLIFRVIDGEAKSYSVEFERRSARDEEAIAERNRTIVQAAAEILRKSVWGAAIWDIAARLLAFGQYRHPIPPDPLAEIWTREVWEPILAAKGYQGGWAPVDIGAADELARELFGNVAQAHDVGHPPDLPAEYLSGGSRRPRPSALAKRGRVKTFTLRVNHRALPKVWRDIELAEDQTLEDLHLIIQRAFRWMIRCRSSSV
ncbi:MAG TPA: hypothetical protein VJ754_02440 [Anaerolineae bacterium]|nr:hypothetical protein [Anaerolineae bacterium]